METLLFLKITVAELTQILKLTDIPIYGKSDRTKDQIFGHYTPAAVFEDLVYNYTLLELPRDFGEVKKIIEKIDNDTTYHNGVLQFQTHHAAELLTWARHLALIPYVYYVLLEK